VPHLVLDTVLAEIDRRVAAHPPERGGALLGPVNLWATSVFAFDEQARTTAVTYQPSTGLNAMVRELESGRDVRFRGICHSHPAGLDRPSRPDCEEAAEGLRRNPHMAEYLLPIVTSRCDAEHAHEIALDSGKISFFSASRSRDGGAIVEPLAVLAVPAGAALAAAAEVLGLAVAPEARVVDVDGVPMLAAAATSDDGISWSLLMSWSPMVPPTVLRDGRPVSIPWDLSVDAADRLAAGLSRRLRAGTRRRPCAISPRTAAGLTSLAARGLDRFADGARRAARAVVPSSARAANGRLARSAPILSPEHVWTRRVVVVGCGSVGSAVADALARTGTGHLTLVDDDAVEAANLSRTVYTRHDIGRGKVDALAEHVRRIDPRIRVRTRRRRVDDAASWLVADIGASHLVIAATDDPTAQLVIDDAAWTAGVPALFVGLTAGARGGETLVVVPRRTVCYGCALAIRQQQPREMRRAMDYGASRLNGEPALGCDIHMMTSAAVRLGLSLLAPAGTDLAAFAERIVGEGTTFLTMGMTPGYWCYPAVFDGVPGQYAFQSVWMSPTSRPDCPRCGAAPDLAVSPVPEAADLRALTAVDGGAGESSGSRPEGEP